MQNLDALILLAFGKQPNEELTPEEELSLQILVAGEERPARTLDFDNAETRETLSTLLELESRKEEKWKRFEEDMLNPLIEKEYQTAISVQQSRRSYARLIKRAIPFAAIAAAVVIALLAVPWQKLLNLPVKEQTAKNSGTVIPAILPGEKNASLFLSDNRIISVKSDESRFPVHEKGALISKLSDGMIAYTLSAEAKQPFFNRLVTLRAQECGVKLPDGTIAWLNNGSTLRYPATFIHKDSAVTLSGEAYFEVDKNRSTPFRVITLQNTQVIANGTKFNIKAYDDDSTVHTTLIEGSVWVRAGNDSTILKKGQQVITNKGVLMPPGNLADTTGVLAWKNGDINFEGENIRSVMKQITRWYSVEVDVRDNVQMDTLVGSIPRNFSLNKVIEKIKEVDQSLQFEWIEKDRKLIVSESTD
jgi:transmembrane sensor